MKKAALYIPVILSLLVLGAHFLRSGSLFGVLGSLLLVSLLMVRQPWVARLMQVVLVLGALEWTRTLYELVQARAADGEPFVRMMIILGVVMTMTFCSALLFQSPELKRIYRLDSRE